MVRQLVGNNDEITDLRFVGPAAAPSHIAVATNSEQVSGPIRTRGSAPGSPGLVDISPTVFCLGSRQYSI